MHVGVPAYRHLLRTDDAGTFSEPLAQMYRHLVADSVTVARLCDV
jgi:hypothetical protein